MKKQILEFHTGSSHMTLIVPDALELMPLGNTKKFFKFVNQAFWINENSMREFFTFIPEVKADLREQWNEAGLEFQRQYKDPNFDSAGNRIDDKVERKKRSDRNRYYQSKVKQAKARFDRFEKRIPKLEELKAIYVKEAGIGH